MPPDLCRNVFQMGLGGLGKRCCDVMDELLFGLGVANQIRVGAYTVYYSD